MTPTPHIPGAEIAQEAAFLIDRLEDLERGWDDEEAYREYAGHVAPSVARLKALLAASPAIPKQEGVEPVAWACVKCNSPRSVDPCPKCGTPLTKPADGWEWPGLPDLARIRDLAREVGYAVGVHGTMERDLDLIAAPWVAEAVEPLALAQHIAEGLGGRVVDFETQDKPCGRWSCNIHTPDWTKMIDLSVMPPYTAGRVERLETATHRHVKRQTEYVLIGIGKMQSSDWLDGKRVRRGQPRGDVGAGVDMREVAIYRSVDDGSLWVRPREEFEDGRFQALGDRS